MFEVTPELVDYLADVACLEKPYAKHVLEVISRKVDEAAQLQRAPDASPESCDHDFWKHNNGVKFWEVCVKCGLRR